MHRTPARRDQQHLPLCDRESSFILVLMAMDGRRPGKIAADAGLTVKRLADLKRCRSEVRPAEAAALAGVWKRWKIEPEFVTMRAPFSEIWQAIVAASKPAK